MRTFIKLGSLALAAGLTLSFGCGGDDDSPPSSTGSGGNGGTGDGGTGGGDGGTGGSDGGTGGSGGSDGGTGGGAGESSGGSGGTGGSDGGTGGGAGDTGTPGKPYAHEDCFDGADGGPSSAVTGAGVGAFVDEDDWLEGWVNFSLDETPEADDDAATEPFPATGDRELDADTVYLLTERVYVTDGETLQIPAGTVIRGEGNQAVLVVSRGGRIEADGTAEAPIIFTSNEPNGSKAPGQWGGVIILGKARSFKGADVQIEGLPDAAENKYGGTADDDDSGFLRYVRLEFGGIEIGDGNEINGLTLGGVGSGTEITHVAVNSNLDDCMEWFGGTVSADHLVGINCGDDIFDADEGYRGTLSTLFGTHVIPLSSDPNGFEMDSSLAGAEPVTHVTAENVTLCGTGISEDNRTYGMVLRENLTGAFTNIVVSGFTAAVDTRDEFGSECDDPNVTIQDSIFFDGVVHDVAYNETGDADNDSGFDEREWFGCGDGNSNPTE